MNMSNFLLKFSVLILALLGLVMSIISGIKGNYETFLPYFIQTIVSILAYTQIVVKERAIITISHVIADTMEDYKSLLEKYEEIEDECNVLEEVINKKGEYYEEKGRDFIAKAIIERIDENNKQKIDPKTTVEYLKALCEEYLQEKEVTC